MRPCRPFDYQSGELCCEATPLSAVAAEVGTPCYIYSRQAILANYRTLAKAFASLEAKICYAVKAGSNLAVLELLRGAGSSFDIVSGGEFYRLDRIGVPPDRIVFSGVGKTREELEAAVSRRIFSLVVESIAEVDALIEVARGREVRISLRVNPEVDAATHPYIATGLRQHKFGIDLESIDEVLQRLRHYRNLRLVGIGAHIGSQILEGGPFSEAFSKVRSLADEIRGEGFGITHLDLGGGLGIPYRDENPFDLDGLAETLRGLRGDYGVIVEPGRYIVGSAGVLLTRVLYHKTNHGKHFFIVDGAMNDLIRPALYSAYHEAVPVLDRPAELTADLVGPVCESGDFLARDRRVPAYRPGDLVAFLDAGAYAFVAASNYNSRRRGAEVMVAGERFSVVRKRETFEDLLSGESVPGGPFTVPD